MKRSYITSHPKILGGTPVVAGTRVPVAQLLYLLRNGSTILDIHKMYGHVSVDTIKKVIDEIAHKLPAISTTTHGQTVLQA